MKGNRQMDKMSYNGYEIMAVPYQLADSGEWTVNVVISKHRTDAVVSRQFSAGEKFRTKQEAIQHCFAFGRQIIDGESESCAVVDL